MILLEGVTPHELPHWSPYAIAVGVVIGFLVGAASALYVLDWFERAELWADPEVLPDPAAEVLRG